MSDASSGGKRTTGPGEEPSRAAQAEIILGYLLARGRQTVQKAAARVREEAEDLWAEARQVKHDDRG